MRKTLPRINADIADQKAKGQEPKAKSRVVPIRPPELTQLQETILFLVIALDPEPVDGILIMLKAVKQHPKAGLVELAKAVAALEDLQFLRAIETKISRCYEVMDPGRAYLDAQLARLGGNLESFQRMVRQAVNEAVLEHMPPAGDKPC